MNHRRRSAIVLVAICVSAGSLALAKKAPLFPGPGKPIPPLKLPKGIGSLSAESCKRCHAEIYEQWKTSQHSKAATGRIWKTCWTARNNPPFCANCHFPLAQQKPGILAGFKESGPLPLVILPRRNFDLRLTQEGVNCAVCHIRNGTILGARNVPPEADWPHPVTYDERLSKPEFCFGCHGWSFPRVRMDNGTCDGLADYRAFRGGVAEKTCQECHTPKRTGVVTVDSPPREYHAHIEGHLARTSEGLQSAIEAKVSTDKSAYQPGETVRAKVTLENKAGHMAPTSCGVRGMYLQVGIVDEGGHTSAAREYRISRGFEFPAYPTETDDTRLQPGEARTYHYQGRIPKAWAGRKASLKASLSYYLVNPKKASEAPLPENEMAIPVHSRLLVLTAS